MNEKGANRVNKFIIELEALTRKHGVCIRGCGCCGSPFLDDSADVSDERAGYYIENDSDLIWVAPSDTYDWEKYSSKIVRDKP